MNETTLLVLVIYLFPTILAWLGKHPCADSIAIINLFLGWTVVGWVGALAWAVFNPRR